MLMKKKKCSNLHILSTTKYNKRTNIWLKIVIEEFIILLVEPVKIGIGGAM